MGSWPNQSNAIITCIRYSKHKAHYEIKYIFLAWPEFYKEYLLVGVKIYAAWHRVVMRMMMKSDNDEENGPLNDS